MIYNLKENLFGGYAGGGLEASTSRPVRASVASYLFGAVERREGNRSPSLVVRRRQEEDTSSPSLPSVKYRVFHTLRGSFFPQRTTDPDPTYLSLFFYEAPLSTPSQSNPLSFGAIREGFVLEVRRHRV